jgi:hypothetical protein
LAAKRDDGSLVGIVTLIDHHIVAIAVVAFTDDGGIDLPPVSPAAIS